MIGPTQYSLIRFAEAAGETGPTRRLQATDCRLQETGYRLQTRAGETPATLQAGCLRHVAQVGNLRYDTEHGLPDRGRSRECDTTLRMGATG